MVSIDRRRYSLNDVDSFVSPRIPSPPTRRVSMSGGKWQPLEVDSDDEEGAEEATEHDEPGTGATKSLLSSLFDVRNQPQQYYEDSPVALSSSHINSANGDGTESLANDLSFLLNQLPASGPQENVSSDPTRDSTGQRKRSILSDDGIMENLDITLDFSTNPFTSGVQMHKVSSSLWESFSTRRVWINVEEMKFCWEKVGNHPSGSEQAPYESFGLRLDLLSVQQTSEVCVVFTVGKRIEHLISCPRSSAGIIKKIYTFQTIKSNQSDESAADLFCLIMNLTDDYVRIRSRGFIEE